MERMQARTLREDVAKELRQTLQALTTKTRLTTECEPEPLLFPWEVDGVTDALVPLVLELIEHAVQVDRIDRGLFPMDEP